MNDLIFEFDLLALITTTQEYRYGVKFIDDYIVTKSSNKYNYTDE